MMIRTTFDPWQQARATTDGNHATNTTTGAALGRRAFMRSTLAATALAVAPARRVWADASKPAAIPARVDAIGLAGNPVSLAAADIKDLRKALRGPLLLAADEGYDTARRIWNPAFDRHPALIARCASAQDVIHAVNFARAHRLRTAVRAGGHSLSGQSAPEGGLMIDVTPMKAIRVDAKRLRAEAQSGVLLGELDQAMQAVGLATTLGTAADTGIAGLTLGGGMGRLMRRFGLAIDNLLGIDVVTADGKLRHASLQENPDLFWGLRGGGGNFGVVTSFQYRLHPLAHKVLSGQRVFPYAQVRSLFAAATDLAEKAPDELWQRVEIINVVTGENPGRYARWNVDYTGEDPAVGQKLIEPLDKIGKPLLDTIASVSYVAAQGSEGAAVAVPNDVKAWFESGFLDSTPQALFDEIVRRFDAVPNHFEALTGFGDMGGAVARVKQEATAYWNRPAKYDLLSTVQWTDPAKDEEGGKAARDLWSGVEPFTRGHYVNSVPDASEKRVRAAYGDNYPRLVKLKEKYDPINLFRMNSNIKPGTASA